jgi:heat shock protein HslJ
MRLLALLFVAVLNGCMDDETVAGYGGAEKIWVLTELDNAPFTARATLQFPETGRIAGKAPCNSFTGAMTVPYPWFEATQVASTRMACPDMAEEGAFFKALSAMTVSEVLGNVLILSNEDGRQMVFKSDD